MFICCATRVRYTVALTETWIDRVVANLAPCRPSRQAPATCATTTRALRLRYREIRSKSSMARLLTTFIATRVIPQTFSGFSKDYSSQTRRVSCPDLKRSKEVSRAPDLHSSKSSVVLPFSVEMLAETLTREEPSAGGVCAAVSRGLVNQQRPMVSRQLVSGADT